MGRHIRIWLAAAAVITAHILSLDAIAAAPADSVDLKSLGVSYWRPAGKFAATTNATDAIITVDNNSITYAAHGYTVSRPYQQKDGVLTLFPPWMTRTGNGAPPPFDQALAASTGVKLDGANLILTGAAGAPTLTLNRFEPAGLEHRRWRIISFFDGTKFVTPDHSVPDFSKPSHPMIDTFWPQITFEDGDLEGSPGCGGLDGYYTLSGKHIMIGAGFDLGGHCPENLMKQNDRVLDALNGKRTIQFDTGKAILLGPHGVTEIILTPW